MTLTSLTSTCTISALSMPTVDDKDMVVATSRHERCDHHVNLLEDLSPRILVTAEELSTTSRSGAPHEAMIRQRSPEPRLDKPKDPPRTWVHSIPHTRNHPECCRA